MEVASTEETQVLRENCRVGNEVKVARTPSGNVHPDDGDFTYWRKEYDKARLSETQAKSEANTFLQCYSEMDELAQRAEEKNQRLQKRLKAMEYQLEASQREVERWKSEHQSLDAARDTDCETKESKVFIDCSVQVWETEFEKCDFSLFATTVDKGQQTDAMSETYVEEDSKNATQEVRNVLEFCIQQVRDATCVVLETEEKEKSTHDQTNSKSCVDSTEDRTQNALDWEQEQIQLSIEQMQKQELELRDTLQLLVNEIDTAKKAYEEVQVDHNRYLLQIESSFRKHSIELDEIARVAENYTTLADFQKSRAEFFKEKAKEQKQVLMEYTQQTQNLAESKTKEVCCNKDKGQKTTELESKNQCLETNNEQLDFILYKQQQVMCEKEAEVYHWKSMVRKTQLKQMSDSIDGPRIASLLDDAAADLQVIEAEILTAIERHSNIVLELAELTQQKQQTNDTIKQLEDSKKALDSALQIASDELDKKRVLLQGEKSDCYRLEEEIGASKSQIEILDKNLEQRRGHLRDLESEIETKKSNIQNEIQRETTARHKAECAEEETRQKKTKLEILSTELLEQQQNLQSNKQRLEEENILLEEKKVMQLDLDKLRFLMKEEECNLQTLHMKKAELIQEIDDLNKQCKTVMKKAKQSITTTKIPCISDVAIQCSPKKGKEKSRDSINNFTQIVEDKSNGCFIPKPASINQRSLKTRKPLKATQSHQKSDTKDLDVTQQLDFYSEDINHRVRCLVKLIRDASKDHDRCQTVKAFRECVILIHELCQVHTEAQMKIESLGKTIESGTYRMKAIEKKLSSLSKSA
eukprot:g9192.t1